MNMCGVPAGGLITSDGPVAVDGNGEYATPHGASPTQAGTYYWVATYSGDPNNKEAGSGCADDPVVIAAKPVPPPPPPPPVLPLQGISGPAGPPRPRPGASRGVPALGMAH